MNQKLFNVTSVRRALMVVVHHSKKQVLA